MGEKSIIIRGERPERIPNPSKCETFRKLYPYIFAPLQSEAFQKIGSGKNVALIAPTSSGKTLAVAAPIFENRKKAVFVYPFRALVLDQTNQLVRYGSLFGLSKADFAQILGGTPNQELAQAVEKDYILMTPDKLVALIQGDRTGDHAAKTILTKYMFVFDEVHAYNSLMQASLRYFIKSVKLWQQAMGGIPQFCFLSATFPEELWKLLCEELNMTASDLIDGVSDTGDVTLNLLPQKNNAAYIAEHMQLRGMTKNVVGIFNTAFTAWKVAENLWGREMAMQRLFVGQDKMSEQQRVANFERFLANPGDGGLCGSPAIEAGIDFFAKFFVIEETFSHNFLQRFGRAGRNGQNACVLCYSDTLYAHRDKLKEEFTRKEFQDLIRQLFPLREPRSLLIGLAAYPYYKFFGDPEFFDPEIHRICKELAEKGVDDLLAFRGFTPFMRYESGECISYRTLFNKESSKFRIVNNRVVGSPSLERYFFSGKREPVIGKLISGPIIKDNIDEDILVFLVKVNFLGFDKHWVVLEFKNEKYENRHPQEEDDNFSLRINGIDKMGRIDRAYRKGILKFYELDA